MSDFLVTAEISTELRRSLPARLPAFLTKQRWFGGKARRISSTEIWDVISFEKVLPGALLLILEIRYEDRGTETYALPLLADAATDTPDPTLCVETPATSRPAVLADALANEQFAKVLLHAIAQGSKFAGERGTLAACSTEAFTNLYGRPEKLATANSHNSGALKPKLHTGEQSNTSVTYGDKLILKFFRRLEEGTNPDLEIGRFLTEKADYKNTPLTAGWLEYNAEGSCSTQAILQAFVPNEGDAWRYTLKSVSNFYDAAAKQPGQVPRPPAEESFDVHEFARPWVTPYLKKVRLLGQRTAELHLALASEHADPSFAPEPFTTEFQRSFEETAVQLTSKVLGLLREKLRSLRPECRGQAEHVAAQEHEITRRFHSLLSKPIQGDRIRVHGDYHLGQVLYTGSDFVIIDFEGEPARPLAERRRKQSPLQDVAGMLRSLHYAAYAPLLGVAGGNAASGADSPNMKAWAGHWYSWSSSVFLNEYFAKSKQASYFPRDAEERGRLLDLYLLEKAVYELGYELNNRPTWVGIPFDGISAILSNRNAARK